MNYTSLVPAIVIMLLVISLPESLANEGLCYIFTEPATENYTCDAIDDTVTLIAWDEMMIEADYANNEIMFNLTGGKVGNEPFDFILFVKGTGYTAINGISGKSFNNWNFATLLNKIIVNASSIFVKSGTYALDSTINLEPEKRIKLDAGTTIQISQSNSGVALGSQEFNEMDVATLVISSIFVKSGTYTLDSTVSLETDESNNLDADIIILPEDDSNAVLGSQEFNETEVDISDEDFDLMEGYREIAEDSIEAENYDEANIYYDKILEIYPSDIDALNGKAQILETINKHEEAIAYYDKILEMDSSDTDALIGKAQGLVNIGKHEEAIIYYDKILEIIPSDIDALNGKAVALENIGKLDEALSILEKIVEEDTLPVEEESPVPVELEGDVSSNENINDFDQSLFIIVTVFVVILISIIIIDFIVKKRTSVEKKTRS